MDIVKILSDSFDLSGEVSRLCFISNHIFNFTTDDNFIDEIMAGNALEVAVAINNGEVYEYIKSSEKRLNYTMMVNFPFFSERIDSGISIRGSWWSHEPIKLESCGIYVNGEQETDLIFTSKEWFKFIRELNNFSTGSTL